VLATARVWVNGDEPEADGATALGEDDEIAVLPPVSGGALARLDTETGRSDGALLAFDRSCATSRSHSYGACSSRPSQSRC
jgi:hypothetical protein